MKYFKLLFYSFFFLMFFVVYCFSYEPSTPEIQNVLSHGEVIFVGRVINSKEIRFEKCHAVAVAEIKLLHCLRGIHSKKGEIIKLEYFSDTVIDRILPVSFKVSHEYLFVFNNKNSFENQLFDSDFNAGLDYAFEIESIDPFVNLKKNYTPNAKRIKLTNIYWDKQTQILSNKIVEELITPLEKQRNGER